MSDCCLTPNDQYEELDNSKNSGKPYKNTNFDKEDTGKRTETYHHRFPNVLIVNGLQYYYCSSRIQPTDTCGLYCLYYFKRRHLGMDLPDIVKDFSIVDLKGNEAKILRSDC
jgi:hypothetical protein